MSDIVDDEARLKPVVKAASAFRTISEVSAELEVPQHVLRFWETKFPQIKPLKRGGGRRYYRPDDVELLRRIQALLYREGYTIRGVQRLLKEARASGTPLPAVGETATASLFADDEADHGAADAADEDAASEMDDPLDQDWPEDRNDTSPSAPLSPQLRELLSDILMDLMAARRLLD